MVRALFGHHKCATTWCREILREASVALRVEMRVIHTEKDWAGYPSLGDMVRAEKPSIIVMTDSRREWVETLPELRGVHVVRDPRDVLVSGYFSHLHSHPEIVDGQAWAALPPHRRAMREMDHDAGLLAEMEFIAPFIEPMSNWNHGNQPGVLEYKMEDLTGAPHRHWPDIYTHLRLHRDAGLAEPLRLLLTRWNLAHRRKTPGWMTTARRVLPPVPLSVLPVSYLPTALDRYSFENLSGGRKKGEENVHHHYRRGVAGDWRNHLNEVHLKAFRDRFGDLVERLGYRP